MLKWYEYPSSLEYTQWYEYLVYQLLTLLMNGISKLKMGNNNGEKNTFYISRFMLR